MRYFSNRYMFIYSAVLVAVVAVVLTVVAVSLKPLQTKNQEAEQKQMILKTIGIEATRDNAAELYAKYIFEDDGYYGINMNDDGTVIPLAGPGLAPICGIIIPLTGTGLWGPIWGYVALDSNCTIIGAVFDHKGETPGLGGEIATDKFAQRFIGKSMIGDQPIQLKKNADKNSKYEVDAISGGTMTSSGVNDMLTKGWLKAKDIYTPEGTILFNSEEGEQ